MLPDPLVKDAWARGIFQIRDAMIHASGNAAQDDCSPALEMTLIWSGATHLWVPLHDVLPLLHDLLSMLRPIEADLATAVGAVHASSKAVAVQLEALALLAVAGLGGLRPAGTSPTAKLVRGIAIQTAPKRSHGFLVITSVLASTEDASISHFINLLVWPILAAPCRVRGGGDGAALGVACGINKDCTVIFEFVTVLACAHHDVWYVDTRHRHVCALMCVARTLVLLQDIGPV